MTLSLTQSLTHSTLLIDIQRATLETCDLWDIWSKWWGHITWPKKNNDKDTDKYKDTFRENLQRAILDTCDLWDIWSEWWGDMTWPKKSQETCEIWGTDYNFDNWEPDFMTILVTWQLRVTLDSIRNSCDVSHVILKIFRKWHYQHFDFCVPKLRWIA